MRVCYREGAWTIIPQSSSQRLCALGRQSYATGDTKRVLKQFFIRKEKDSPSGKAVLPSLIKTIKDKRSYHPLAVSFSSSLYSESCTLLQFLMLWKCCSTTLCPSSQEKPKTYGFWIEWRGRSTAQVGGDTQTLCVGIPRIKSERALNFFFSADWRKSMRAHNEKHRKKLFWP